MARPMPSPLCVRRDDPSSCLKRSNTCGRNLRAMPLPLSTTEICICDPTRRRLTSTRSPRAVNFSAFESRLNTIWARRSRSPTIEAGVAFERERERHALGVERRHQPFGRRLDQLVERHVAHLETHLAGDDAAHVEQLVDDARLRARVPVDDGQAAFDFRRHVRSSREADATSREWHSAACAARATAC